MTETNNPPVLLHRDGHIAILELNRPPHNFFDLEMISLIADHLEALEVDSTCRSVVLQANGSGFCAGADFSKRDTSMIPKGEAKANPLYMEALRIFAFAKPIVAAIEGSAIGGGLGVALVADFRVGCPEVRFSANFNRLGFHPGFALSYTLPALIGKQLATWMFYTGARVDGEHAKTMGLLDFLTPKAEVRAKALALAKEVAISSPRAVQSTRKTLKADSLEKIRNAIALESAEQAVQFASPDLIEGVRAMAEKRQPHFAD